jgi:succinate dehydrogenase/fumarate reductase flavoprotein subunit
VTDLITEDGEVVGCVYKTKDGKSYKEYGPVIVATGGYGADFSKTGVLAKYRPDLLEKKLSTTNGPHCTGDGLKFCSAAGAGLSDMDVMQVHPTGLVDPRDPDNKTKYLAAEALRGAGGILLNRDGFRFCDDLGHRDYVSGMMWKNKGPFRLVLNEISAKKMEWHCKHYEERGLMTRYKNGAELAKAMGIPLANLEKSFADYNAIGQVQLIVMRLLPSLSSSSLVC